MNTATLPMALTRYRTQMASLDDAATSPIFPSDIESQTK